MGRRLRPISLREKGFPDARSSRAAGFGLPTIATSPQKRLRFAVAERSPAMVKHEMNIKKRLYSTMIIGMLSRKRFGAVGFQCTFARHSAGGCESGHVSKNFSIFYLLLLFCGFRFLRIPNNLIQFFVSNLIRILRGGSDPS
jgi:hypothetical protein